MEHLDLPKTNTLCIVNNNIGENNQPQWCSGE